MDEYVGLERDHPESYHTFMWENLFKHVDIDPANVHIPDGNAPDLVAECKAYEQKIKDAGGIRLFLGGQHLMLYLYYHVSCIDMLPGVCQELVLMVILLSMSQDLHLVLELE
jgi:hypothetical protein